MEANSFGHASVHQNALTCWCGRWEVEDGKQSIHSHAHSDAKHTLVPQSGRLVLFEARRVMHEVLPTHRKRFAATLWLYRRDGGSG